jgi:hypothetical protein
MRTGCGALTIAGCYKTSAAPSSIVCSTGVFRIVGTDWETIRRASRQLSCLSSDLYGLLFEHAHDTLHPSTPLYPAPPGVRSRGRRWASRRKLSAAPPTTPRLKVPICLILAVVICLSQRLSHACLSINLYTVKLRMAH